MVELGVNIDHVATLRQARMTYEPDPIAAAYLAEQGGADGITFHLREDRRHIQDRDVRLLSETVAIKKNMELGCDAEIVGLACEVEPDWALLVPERRQEVTTEGGLDVAREKDLVGSTIDRLHAAGVAVSLFIDPDIKQVEAAASVGAEAVELHTGPYALASGTQVEVELDRLRRAGDLANASGLRLHAGHGLNYRNVHAVAVIDHLKELNIGHAIIARAVFVGLRDAVAEMKREIEFACLRQR